MKKLPGKFISLLFFSFILVLILSQTASAAELTPTPNPSNSPQASASTAPSGSPKASPAASSSPATAATPTVSSQPAASSTGGDDKKSEVLGKTDVLGATGTEREIAKWIFVLGTGIVVFFIGLNVARKVNKSDEE